MRGREFILEPLLETIFSLVHEASRRAFSHALQRVVGVNYREGVLTSFQKKL